jgi:predicted nucleic acid-binding protein
MPAYYADSSALVKRYVAEVGSAWLAGVVDPRTRNEIFVALVSGAEIVAAIARRIRTGSITAADGAAAITAFRNHFATQYQTVLATTEIVEQAMGLAERHGLRGYDAVQLACALVVQSRLGASGGSPLTFLSADTGLNRAAQAEGLSVDDPNAHP